MLFAIFLLLVALILSLYLSLENKDSYFQNKKRDILPKHLPASPFIRRYYSTYREKIKKEIKVKVSNFGADETVITFNTYIPFVHLTIIFIISLLTVMYPKFWMFCVMPLIFLSLAISYGPFIQMFFPKKNIVLLILKALKETQILDTAQKLHLLVFYTETKLYLLFASFCFGNTLMYMVVSRYNFYHKVVLHEHFTFGFSFLIITLLIIGFAGSYLRTLIGISNVIVSASRAYNPDLLFPILRTEPADYPPDTPNSQRYSLFSFERHQHHHNHLPKIKSTNWSKLTFFGTLAGLAISMAAYHHISKQTDAALRSADEAKRTADAAVRSADAAEVSAGLMTPDEFKTKWGMPPTKK